MTRETLIKRTIDNLTKLPDQKLKEVSDFAEFLMNRIENQLMTEGIQKLVSDSKAFKFLEGEEDLYSVADLKETYKWVDPSQSNGLKKTSLIRLSKLATIDKDLVMGKLGNLLQDELTNVDKNLLKLFKLVQWLTGLLEHLSES